jgi:hypothetical protein
MMTHDTTLALLDDFVDGALDPRVEREVRRHLMQCEACRAEERELRTLLDLAAALPDEIVPERDLWAGIAPRLEARPATAAPARGAVRSLRALPPWLLAAAAVVALVVTTSLVTLELAPAREGALVQLPAKHAGPPTAAGGVPTAQVVFRPAEREYEQAILDLSAVLEARRAQLAPETARVVEENLRLIDRAIAESRAALDADPASRELTQMLADAYQIKLGVLRRAVQL